MPAHSFLIASAFLLTVSSPLPAYALETFQAAAQGAVAILPKPLKARAITGGSLFCAEQRWTLHLRAERRDMAASPTESATLAIDGESFPATAEQSLHDIAIRLERDMVESLRDGNKLEVAVEGKEPASAIFSLTGSSAVLDAVAPRCSPIQMSGYEAVSLAPDGPGLDAARPLISEEAALFREATEQEPIIAAALMQLDGRKQLLFASLCGSSRYYGETGCKLVGYAAELAGAWRPVYESEGMLLYRDPNGSRDGWPNIATVPMVHGVEALNWSWDGEAYALQDPAIAGETTDHLRGSTAQ